MAVPVPVGGSAPAVPALSPKHARFLLTYGLTLGAADPLAVLDAAALAPLPAKSRDALARLATVPHLPLPSRRLLGAYYAAGYAPGTALTEDLANAQRLANAPSVGAEGLRALMAQAGLGSDLELVWEINRLVGDHVLRPSDRIRLDAALALLRLKGHTAEGAGTGGTQATQIVIHTSTLATDAAKIGTEKVTLDL